MDEPNERNPDTRVNPEQCVIVGAWILRLAREHRGIMAINSTFSVEADRPAITIWFKYSQKDYHFIVPVELDQHIENDTLDAVWLEETYEKLSDAVDEAEDEILENL